MGIRGSGICYRGPAGRDGINGKDGLNGTNGKDGINGTNGTNGTNGKDGAVGPPGPALVTASASTRTLGTVSQPHATKPVFVSYSVKTSVTVAAVAGVSTAAVTLLSDAANPPTTERARADAMISAGLAVALTTSNTAPLTYLVPAGHYVKLVSTVVGTGTTAIVSQTEVVLG